MEVPSNMIPALFDHVRVQDRCGVFLVTRVNREAETVDLVPCSGGVETEDQIPFKWLMPDELRRCRRRDTSVELIGESGQ